MGIGEFPDLAGFDRDKGNAGKNLKHNVTDGECEEIFFNAPLLMSDDAAHANAERRFAAFGITNAGRSMTLVFTIRGDLIRVISARDMNKRERRFYKSDEENT